MLTATSLAVALIASSTLLPTGAIDAPVTAPLPPMIVTVTAPQLPPRLLHYALAEADAIWKGSGVIFLWREAPRSVPSTSPVSGPPALPNSVRVVFGDAPGLAAGGGMPLGWIVFDDVTTPEQEIYVSYGNALRLLRSSRGVVGLVEQMTTTQRETLLGRAMGRALAHEIGHYLFASKIHTRRGLMKATRTAFELFTPDPGGFVIEAGQRQVIMARLKSETGSGTNQ